MASSVLWWDTDEELETRATEAHRRATALFGRQGRDKKGVFQDALIAYFGNSRHQDGGAYVGGMGIMDLLGGSTEPSGQNVIQMIVDLMVSNTVHNKIRPFALTENGDVQAREDAKQITRAVEGIFHIEKLYGSLGITIAKLGFIGDGAFCKVVPDFARKKVTLIPVLAHEWLVPSREGSNPRQGYHVYPMDRAMLLEDFGWTRDKDGKRKKTEFYEAIKEATSAPRDLRDDFMTDDETSDQVLVIEAYHLPSGFVDLDDEASFGMAGGELDDSVDPGHDGRRMLMIGGITEGGVRCLVDEPYPYDEFDICEFFPSLNPTGYGSRGVPETLAAGQLAVNRWNRRIDAILQLHAVPRLVAWRQSKINVNKITNGLADILWSNVPGSQAVQYLQPPPIPPELLNRPDKLIAWMKAQYGVNDMALSGEKPPGLDHAPGMEHLSDEFTLRHTEKDDGWKSFCLKVARRSVEACRLLAMRDPDFEIVYFGDDKELIRIVWKDVEMKRKAFIMRIWPASLLPQHPGPKLRRLGELKAIFPEMGPQLQGALIDQYPDIAAFAGQAAAAEKNIRRTLDNIAREGFSEKYVPHPYMNIALAKALAAEKINELEYDGSGSDTVDDIIKFHEQCIALELAETAKKAAAEQGVMPPGAPAPEPPPPGALPSLPPMPPGPPPGPPGPPMGAPPRMQ